MKTKTIDMIEVKYTTKTGEECTKFFLTQEEAIHFLDLNSDFLDLDSQEVNLVTMIIKGEKQQ